MPNFIEIGGVTRKPLVDLTWNDPVTFLALNYLTLSWTSIRQMHVSRHCVLSSPLRTRAVPSVINYVRDLRGGGGVLVEFQVGFFFTEF